MNEAAKRTVAAEMIQRRWRAKNGGAPIESGTTLPDGKADGSTAGRPVGLGAASSGGDRQSDGKMPPGLTKMQQMAWKRKREKEQEAQ